MINTNLAEKINIVRVPVKELKPSAYNPRKWDEKAIADMKESISRFGLCDPLIVNGASERKNIVIGGHLRLKVATLLGFTEVPVVYLNIPEIEREKELNLRLNKNVGAWDEELLKAFDTDMLLDVGFTPDELNSFFDDVLEIQDDGFNVEEELTKIVTPETKPGEIYQLGEHRLICGDATDPGVVAKLMGDDRASMIFSDPPYNIALDYRKGIGTKGKYTPEKLVNDSKGAKEYEKFLGDAIKNALAANRRARTNNPMTKMKILTKRSRKRCGSTPRSITRTSRPCSARAYSAGSIKTSSAITRLSRLVTTRDS